MGDAVEEGTRHARARMKRQYTLVLRQIWLEKYDDAFSRSYILPVAIRLFSFYAFVLITSVMLCIAYATRPMKPLFSMCIIIVAVVVAIFIYILYKIVFGVVVGVVLLLLVGLYVLRSLQLNEAVK